MNTIGKILTACLICLLVSACINITVERREETIPSPAVHNETVEPTSFATIAPPSDFILYKLPNSSIGIYIPGNWFVTGEIPGEFAILQSYPEDKNIGGGARQPEDTKCDMRINPPGTDFDNQVEEVRSDPSSTIISEQAVMLNSGEKAMRFEINSLGQSLSIFADIEGQVVSLVCFGNLDPFNQIAFTLTSIN